MEHREENHRDNQLHEDDRSIARVETTVRKSNGENCSRIITEIETRVKSA